eukprot:COSAG04_NODE_399_length_14959_cov_28.238730_2_plen_65_part_00
MAPSHGYNLRRRKPKRTDPLLTEIYDALPEDLLCMTETLYMGGMSGLGGMGCLAYPLYLFVSYY